MGPFEAQVEAQFSGLSEGRFTVEIPRPHRGATGWEFYLYLNDATWSLLYNFKAEKDFEVVSASPHDLDMTVSVSAPTEKAAIKKLADLLKETGYKRKKAW